MTLAAVLAALLALGVVARGMGKCCVSGAGEIKVDYKAKTVELVLRGSLDKAGLLGRSQTWKRKK